MAITITNLSSLGAFGLANYNLVSPFESQCIEYTVDWDGAEGVTSVVIGGFTFTPLNTIIADTVYTYQLDVTDVLRYFVDKPLNSGFNDGMSYDLDYTIHADATTSAGTMRLCYCLNTKGGHTEVGNLQKYGSDEKIYHNGVICFYIPTFGEYSIQINGIAHSYFLNDGFNILPLNSTQLISGTLTAATTHISIPVHYDPRSGSEVSWLSKDGRWSYWNFRKLNEAYASKESNEVLVFSKSNEFDIQKSYPNNRNVTKRVMFDTIAVDALHFELLIDLVISPVVIFDGLIWKVSSCSDTIADVKQNLNFKLTLETEINAVSY